MVEDGTTLGGLVRLAEAARAGGRAEMEALLAASAGLAHAVARARLSDTLAAEEAAIATLARVARGFAGLRNAPAYPRWLARVADRCAADESRARRRLPDPIRVDPPAPGAGPEAAAAAAEDAARVRRAVASMPCRLRAPLLLTVVEGLSYREVASVLGTGLATVSRRVERALAAMRRSLGGQP